MQILKWAVAIGSRSWRLELAAITETNKKLLKIEPVNYSV